MKNEHISDALNLLSDDLVEETAEVRRGGKRPNKTWRKWVVAAACLCILAAGAVVIPRLTQTTPGGLPMLEVPETVGDGMGFEGVLQYDIADMYNGNPWNDSMELSTLPVFQNGSYHAAGVPTGLTQDAMLERLEAAAAALGMEIGVPESEKEEGEVVRITADADGIQIEVTADGTVVVWFEDGLELPEEYHFTHYDTTDEEANKVLDYLIEQYSDLIGFTRPEKVLSGDYVMWNDYDDSGNYLEMPKYARKYLVYEAAGDDTEDILNYCFRSVHFAPNDDGRLMLIRIYDSLSCAEKLGDYPIITAEEARAMLLNGNYITSVPYEITDERLVGQAELVYRNSRTEMTFMPYYRFYVELPEMERDDGLTDYGAYYVPAVQAEYISNMPLWDGSIN